MRAYIVEYRLFNAAATKWSSKISQEGYATLEAAQQYIESRPNHPAQIAPMLYETDKDGEFYHIHDVMIVERLAAANPPPPRPYERARDAVHATGNKWAIENFHATHD